MKEIKSFLKHILDVSNHLRELPLNLESVDRSNLFAFVNNSESALRHRQQGLPEIVPPADWILCELLHIAFALTVVEQFSLEENVL